MAIEYKKTAFNLYLTQTQHDMLAALAVETAASMSEMLRATIIKQFRMKFSNEPYCVSGQKCFCPQMHRVPNAQELTDEDLLEEVKKKNAENQE